MVFVVRKATEQTALALTSDLAAYGERARWSANEVILVCVSGRGDKDVAQVMEMGILDG